MAYPKNNFRGKCNQPSDKAVRNINGSIMPFIAVSVILFMGTVGIALELTRVFETVRELEFAAQIAALYGCSLSTNSGGSYSISNAQANIVNAVINTGTAAWNMAECGPIGNMFGSGSIVWSEPVTFAPSDVQFVSNPLDSTEFFTQVTARRQGSDALQEYLLPLFWLYTVSIGSQLPTNQYTVSTYQTAEVLGQPASRIGAGAPSTSQTGSTAGNFVGWAALPIAISNQEFAAASSVSQTTTTYTIDLVTPSTTGAVQAGHIRGCLVNVAAGTSSGSSYYGAGTGSTAVNQLIGLLNYFTGNSQQSLAPAIVEQGSQLNAFNPTDPNFVNQQAQITQLLQQLPSQDYIVPVIANDPSFSSANTVVGFARLLLNPGGINTTGGAPTSLSMNIDQSVPAYNASATAGFSAIPGNTSNPLPAPVSPFLPRQYDPTSGGVTVRPRGIILAPAISPRQIKFS